ncbi:hypothetical protein [Absidia glauca]|uniref:GH18 domain-containing protein n=1 Tax=Absidia glauca TaxID=4829 RepID=A0A163J128_ABSGL|nr:hypothetical protein [Absidia glauca]
MAAPPPPVTNGSVIAGYFVNWGIYARNYNVTDLAKNAQCLTHILYAFANLEPSGQVILGDVWADKDKHFSPEQTVDGRGDPWSDNDASNLFGNFKQLYLLKQRYRHLKVSLSIGGWTWSTNFAGVAADPSKRAVFVRSAVQHLGDLGLDGIGHQSALHGPPGSLHCHQAVADYIAAGVPASKLVMGMPAYGRAFSQTNGPQCPYQDTPEGSWEKGQYDYKALPRPGAQESHDPQQVASWSYDPVKREYVTYDSPVVVQTKCDYIGQMGLAGAMFWELSADHPVGHPRSLVHTVHRALGHHLDSMPNHLDYPASQYANMRNSMQS